MKAVSLAHLRAAYHNCFNRNIGMISRVGSFFLSSLWQPFVDVVVTKCKHYFCEHCALKWPSLSYFCNLLMCNLITLVEGNGVF
nr:zinc finger ccch domain-containing protein 15 [Quercus suber]